MRAEPSLAQGVRNCVAVFLAPQSTFRRCDLSVGSSQFKTFGDLSAKKEKLMSSEAKELRTKEHANRKSDGAHDVGKSIVHVEDVTHHSGREHPPATRLADSKLLKGKLRKSDE
jgi:hypothetical protein